ncbi:uncharacterized protein LOC144703723 [Wolffia australiana]
MEVGSRLMNFLGKKDNVVHLFLGGAFVALGFRSAAQQEEINQLEAEKDSLSRSNKAMQKDMWEWRQTLFNLASSDPSNFPIPLSRLRAIYGDTDEAESPSSSASPSSGNLDFPEAGVADAFPPPTFTV